MFRFFPFCCFFRCIFFGVVLNLHPFFRQGNLGANMFFIFFVDMFFFKDKNPFLPGKVASAAKHCRFELRRTKLVATEVWHTKHFAMFFWGGVEFAPIFPTRKSGRKHVFHLFCRYVFFFMIRIHLYLARWQALPSIADCCAVCLQFIARLALLGLWATGVARCLRSWAACASYMFSNLSCQSLWLEVLP